jgi:predicted  nucleic acid-binding Zn-ribbon protein
MRHTIRTATVAAAVALAAIGAWNMLRPSATEAAESAATSELEKLSERVAALEQVLGETRIGIDRTVARRLDDVEARIKTLGRQMESGGRADERTIQALQRELADSQRHGVELERRLSAVERERRAADPLPRELTDLRRQVDTLERNLRDVQGRLNRLESRR